MAEEKSSPISAVKPPKSNPLKPAGAEHASTLKLKPVIRKPALGGSSAGLGAKLPVKPITRAATDETPAPTPAPAAPAPAPEAPKPAIDQLKSVTQRLKGVTQEIPQQAILRKTGIIGDQSLTAAQKQASKARTARISLSDALGVAPVKEAPPMKTIRIKRPVDIPAATPAAAPESATMATVDEPLTQPTEAAPTVSQRKTLKVSRPGAARPPTKLGIKKPGAPAAAEPAADGDVADIADIPEIPTNVPAFAPPPPPASDVPKGLAIFSLIIQVAACAVMGVALYWFINDWKLPNF